MNAFESHIQEKVKEHDPAEIIDILLSEFPSELQERIEEEIKNLDYQSASDYIIGRLLDRKKVLAESNRHRLPDEIQISYECPLAVLQSLDRVTNADEVHVLGKGNNGKVYQSVRQPDACYKVLFLERAIQLQSDIVREALVQYKVSEIVNNDKTCARVPDVYCFVDHAQVRAIMMEKIEGDTLLNILQTEEKEFPINFDFDVFFKKLENTVQKMNENGYFHRDLTNNAGNVMVDTDGEPWLIDFGSAIKAETNEGIIRTYQITVGGPHIVANDSSGLIELKKRVRNYLREKGGK